MKTNIKNWRDRLANEIKRAVEYDRRGDVTLREQIVRQLLGDEGGIPLASTRQALRAAGLIR